MADRFVAASLFISSELHSSPTKYEKFQYDTWGWSFNSHKFYILWFEKEAWSTITCCYILAQLNLYYNTPRLFGIPLRLLISISWKASSGSLQFCAPLAVFRTFLPIMPVHLSFHSYKLYKLEGFTLMLFFSFMFFSGSKFCPSLIDYMTVPSSSIRTFTQFPTARQNVPSVWRATHENLVCGNTEQTN